MVVYVQSLSHGEKIFFVIGGILLFSLIVHLVYKLTCSIMDKLALKMFPPFLLLLLIGCFEASQEPPCNTAEVYATLAEDFEKLAALKRMCGHLVGGSDYGACRHFPYTEHGGMDCASLKNQEEDLKAFLERNGRPLREACVQDENCQSWRKSYKSSVEQVTSPIPFSAVELSQESPSTPGARP